MIFKFAVPFLFLFSGITQKNNDNYYLEGKRKLINNKYPELFQQIRLDEVENFEIGRSFAQRNVTGKILSKIVLNIKSTTCSKQYLHLNFYNLSNNKPTNSLVESKTYLRIIKKGFYTFNLEKLNVTIPENGIFISVKLSSVNQLETKTKQNKNSDVLELGLFRSDSENMFIRYKNEKNWYSKNDSKTVDKTYYERLFLCNPMIFIETKPL